MQLLVDPQICDDITIGMKNLNTMLEYSCVKTVLIQNSMLIIASDEETWQGCTKDNYGS